MQDIEYPEFPPTASDTTFPAVLPDDVVIDTAFLSHYHWDHVGNPGLLPRGTKLVFGKGSLEKIGQGYPDGDPWFDAHWIRHCHFTETEFDSGAIGDFPRAKDWFGDGSFWLIDCPGVSILLWLQGRPLTAVALRRQHDCPRTSNSSARLM